MAREERNYPKLDATIYEHQMGRLKRQSASSGLTLSRIVREKLEYADSHGYHPGSISVRDLRQQAIAATNRGA